jgi:Domain of unknown function (DUF4920)
VKQLFVFIVVIFALAGTAFAQDHVAKNSESKEEDRSSDLIAEKTVFPIVRGAAIGKAKKASLSEVLKSPEKYAGQTVSVEGVIVRSCKAEGCWMELAPDAKSASVRVKMKDHDFFIPLNSAGHKARAEGTVSVKVRSKAEVEHLIEDGAKFENRNPDGTVTEVSFEATGVELSK